MKSILIIGAGPAGLTAAYELLKNKYRDVIVLESESHLGGIAATSFYQGNYMDMGGHRFFTKSQEVMKLWQELLPLQGAPSLDEIILGETNKDYPGQVDPQKEDEVFLRRRRVSRIYYLRHFFSYPISVSFGMLRNLGLVRIWQVGWSYLYSMIFKREEKSLEDFYINRFGQKLYSMFFENYTEKIWGIQPSKISPDWGAQRVKGLSIIKILGTLISKTFGNSQEVETSLIEEFYYPKLGPGQMWQVLADKVQAQGGKIELERCVTKLEKQTDGSYLVTTKDKQGEEHIYKADIVFSSMAISDLVQALSAVPQPVYDIAVSLPYRDFITVGLLLNKLKLENTTQFKTVGNIVPDCWIYVQEHGVKLGRLQIFNNWSPYLVKDLKHTVWMGLEYFCHEGDKMWTMPQQEFIAQAIQEAERIGVIDKCDVLDATQVKVKKAYPAYFGSYKDFSVVRNYLQSIDGLYCIGRNGQHRYNNMDHSMLTAMEAVRAVQGKVDKNSIWQVNTEQEYHEGK